VRGSPFLVDSSGNLVVTRPQPFYLEAAGHACAAWWHAPAALAAPPLPVAAVLASSWGEEDVASYDDQRALAEALADAGIGVLRFEWPDVGDSSAPTGGVTIAEALAAFDCAAETARQRSGQDRLAFVGLRLGALLAAHAAVARCDVDALVALLPVASGRAFVRDGRMLGAEGEAMQGRDEMSGALMFGGFALPQPRATELAALNWPTTAATAITDAFILSRPGSPGLPCADALARMGVRAREWAAVEPSTNEVRVAPEAIAEVVRWLRERALDPAAATHTPPAARACGSATTLRVAVRGGAVRERVCEIAMPRANGELAAPLVAVLCERDAPAGAVDRADDGRPPPRGVLLLAPPPARRIGPHRLWVAFARERAARGDIVLRLDLAGRGDSDARPPRRADAGAGIDALDPRCVDDIARALAWLRREHGVGACTVMGLGAGGHHAWRAALYGIDLQQVVAINPPVFQRSPGSAHEFERLPLSVTEYLLARARRALGLRPRDPGQLVPPPQREDLAAELTHVSRRGVTLDFVFSEGEPGLALLREEQRRGGLRRRRDGPVRVSEIGRADAGFARPAARAALYARLDELLEARAPAPVDDPQEVLGPSAAVHS
jgi:alpha/beta superfamily hydrolase